MVALDHLDDFLGGLAGACRETAHFVGDHGKAAPLLAGPRCFDRGVEGQQVGLVGNATDGADNAADHFRLLAERGNVGCGLLQFAGNALHHAHRALHDAGAFLCAGIGLLGNLVGQLGGLALGAGLLHLFGDIGGQLDDLVGAIVGIHHRVVAGA